MRPLVLTLAAALLTMSCGTDPNVFHVGCQQVDAFDVGSGLTPSISWSPDCRVASVGVYQGVPTGSDPDHVPPLPGTLPGLTTGSRMWQITSPASVGNLLEPTLRYGRSPDGAIEDSPASPLVAGQLYLVVLAADRTDGALPRLQWTGQFRP
jgi:hypothetical protein